MAAAWSPQLRHLADTKVHVKEDISSGVAATSKAPRRTDHGGNSPAHALGKSELAYELGPGRQAEQDDWQPTPAAATGTKGGLGGVVADAGGRAGKSDRAEVKKKEAWSGADSWHDQSQPSGKGGKSKDKGSSKGASKEGSVRSRIAAADGGCFICGGPHFARECPEGGKAIGEETAAGERTKMKGKGKGDGKARPPAATQLQARAPASKTQEEKRPPLRQLGALAAPGDAKGKRSEKGAGKFAPKWEPPSTQGKGVQKEAVPDQSTRDEKEAGGRRRGKKKAGGDEKTQGKKVQKEAGGGGEQEDRSGKSDKRDDGNGLKKRPVLQWRVAGKAGGRGDGGSQD